MGTYCILIKDTLCDKHLIVEEQFPSKEEATKWAKENLSKFKCQYKIILTTPKRYLEG